MSNFEPRGRGRGQSRGRGSGFNSRGTSPTSSRSVSPSAGRGRGRGGSFSISIYNPGPARVDPRINDRDMDALISGFKKLDTKDRVIRPGFGKRGTNVTLRANFFALNYPKNVVLYDHPLKIEPEVEQKEKRLRARLFELFEQSPVVKPYLDGIAHDKMQRLIAIRPLPKDFSATIDFYEAGEKGPRPEGSKKSQYTISTLSPRELKSSDLDNFLQGNDPNYDSLPIISAFNLITTAHASRTGVQYGKNRYFFSPGSFSPSEAAIPLSNRIEAWKGFFASVRPTVKCLMMNVNVCTGAFYIPCERLSDLMERLGPSSASFLRRVRITTSHLGYRRKYSIKAFSRNSAKQESFDCQEYGGKITVEQYFLKKYNKRLTKPNLPVLNIGNSKKDIFIPAELCEVEPGQPYGGTLSESETAEMIKVACNPPSYNAETIAKQGLQMLGLSQRASPMAKFGVQISPDMSVITGRILPPPRVSYSVGQPRVDNGSWNVLNVKFSKPSKASRLAILVLPDGGRDDFRNEGQLRGIVDGFLDKCRKCGMNIGSPAPPKTVVLPRQNQNDPLRLKAIDAIEAALGEFPSKPDMVLVFVSNRDPHIYPGLKKLCDTKLGISTVCMLMSKVGRERGQDQYFSNIALKVNAKLGGVNHTISTDSLRWMKDAMLVGMDVTHPGKGSVKGTPSIAAVVASCDSSFIQYPASMRLQECRKEMITEVKDMMKERLKEYQKNNGKLPERVIVFRDGVSEGQFDIVLKDEVREIKAAFRSFKSYSPKLTVTICGKRHHTRFFPTSEANADKTSNTKAGTVVDNGVTSVYDFDFYLQAHAGLQGTVRATHYSVIYDENKLGADDIQQGVNDISYLWARATKSVSLIPPAYWADRACERGRAWLHGVYPPPVGSREMGMDEKQIERRVKEIWGGGIHDSLKGTMFYL